MTQYPTLDKETTSIVFTIFDPETFIFFDPKTNKTYDAPYVFKDENDMKINLPFLISELVNEANNKIRYQEQLKAFLTTTLIKYTTNKTIFFYIDPLTTTVKPTIKYLHDFIDALSNKPINQTIYDSINETLPILKNMKAKHNNNNNVNNKHNFIWKPTDTNNND